MNWGIQMTDKRDLTEAEALDALFADIRSEAQTPADGFMARIMADAASAMPKPEAPVAVAPSGGWGVGLWAALGGWTGTGGLAAAAVAGLWIGIAPPDIMSGVSTLIWGETQSVSLFAVDDILGTEG